jgi:hypothetical protein
VYQIWLLQGAAVSHIRTIITALPITALSFRRNHPSIVKCPDSITLVDHAEHASNYAHCLLLPFIVKTWIPDGWVSSLVLVSFALWFLVGLAHGEDEHAMEEK